MLLEYHTTNLFSAMAVVFGWSSKRKQTVIYHNFEYVKDRDNVNTTTAWRCRMYQSMKCKARLTTIGSEVVKEHGEHTHSGNVATALGRRAVGEMKAKMDSLLSTPSSSQAAVVVTLDDHVLMALPKHRALSRTLQREKCRQTAGDNIPAAPSDLMFVMPQMFEDMVLFDSGPGEDRFIILGCQQLLDGLARADLWLADGTFKVVPHIFFQLYSIHFNFGSGINPAGLYCLLTNKTGDTYRRLLSELKRLIPLAAPKKILVDFERATINAFADAYPSAVVTGCYFHLSQSVLRKVNEVGLKTIYESNDEVRGFVRCLPALAFVPAADVVEAFELLVETMPIDVDHLEEVISFFEHTYVRGRRQRGRGEHFGQPLFAIDMWNQYSAGMDGIARTTNSVEGWHHSLLSLFQCSHPTLWNCMNGLRRDMQQQKAVFLQGSTGIEHPSKKRYRDLNERVRRAVASYGRADVLVYIRAITHLSHN